MGLFDEYKRNNLNESKDWSSAMENNNANIDRLARLRTQVNIDPVMEEVIDSTEKANKNAKEVFTKLAKDASSTIPKDPSAGKKITIKPYTEKLTLDENLFKESIDKISYDDLLKIQGKIDRLIRKMAENQQDEISQNSNTYGIGVPFIGTYKGYIDLQNTNQYIEGHEDDWDEDDDYYESLKKRLSENWALEPGKTFRSKSNNEITIKKVIPYVSEYDGTSFLRIKYDYVLNNGEFGSSECSEKDLFNMLNESVNLLEYASEDMEDDEYTVYDLLNDRLFGYGINKSNFRVKWKFAEIEPTVKTRDGKLKRGYFYPTIHQDELVTGKGDDRRAFTEDGIGVFVHDEDEASLAKKCAEELDLDFVMKKLVRPHNGFNYVATIKVSDDIQEMPIKDYMESIGKSMSDILRGKGDKIKSNFKDSKNYQSRKTNK